MRRNARGAAAAAVAHPAGDGDADTVVSAANQDSLVDPADIHSHAKLCLEATMNAPCATPPLRGELGGLGIGLRTLLVAAPVAHCTALASMALSSGSFPPLKWEVCASRKENKPLSLSVVPGDGGLAECIGACFHTDWLWPAELFADRRDLVVPLFAKLAAVYIYATEEKEIMNEFTFSDMGTFGGTSASQGTANSSRKKWKFTGLSYGGCVATVCSLFMPAQFVASLVTFGSPPVFSVVDTSLMPFPYSHLQHTHDLMPHILTRSAAARIAARLTGLGYLVPDPPIALPNVTGKLNKRGEPVDLYRHDLAHVMILTPSQAQIAFGAALKKQEVAMARLNESSNAEINAETGVRIERLPVGNTPALLVAISTLFDRRHGPIPETLAKMMPRQQYFVMPKLEACGRNSAFDLRMQLPRMTIRDYFLPLRTMLGKRIELTPVVPADGSQVLGTFLNNVGECATKRIAADILNLTSGASTVPSNVSTLAPAQVNFAEYVALCGYRSLQIVQQLERGNDLSSFDVVEGGIGGKKGPIKIPVGAIQQCPPLLFGTVLELVSDTFDGLRAFLKQLRPAAGWDVDRVARQLAAWSGGLPVASMVATAFISAQWLPIACSPPLRKTPLSRHVSTAAIVDTMNSGLRSVLSSPDGHHFEWSVAIGGVTHGVGKSTLIHLLTRELVQSRFGPDGELDEANRPTPARRGGAQEAVLRMKWSWAASVDAATTDTKAGKAGFGQGPPRVSIGDDAQFEAREGAPAGDDAQPKKSTEKKRTKSSSPTKTKGGAAAPKKEGASKDSRPGGVKGDSVAAAKQSGAASGPADGAVDQKNAAPPPAEGGEAGDDAGPMDAAEAEALLKLTDAAKRLILPPSILLRLHLDEVHYDASFGSIKRLGRYAQVLWLVTDRFTAERFAAMATRLHDSFCSYQQHVILYCPRRPPSSVRPPPGQQAQQQQQQQDDSVIAVSVEDAERVHVELIIKRLQREYHLRVAHIDVNPAALSNMHQLLAASQTMMSLQRLLMQWMVPRLPLPVDPHAMPRGVDMGALFTRCDDVVEDYLRSSTECHLMGTKAQKAFLLHQAVVRGHAMGVVGRRRGTLGLTQFSVQSYDDVDRGVKLVAVAAETDDSAQQPQEGTAGASTPPA